MNNETLRVAQDKGLTAEEYKQRFLERAEIAKLPENVQREPKLEHVPLNKQRSTRIEKTYLPSVDIVEAIYSIKNPQTWVIITEDWCGDSAQILPYFIAIAQLNKLIEVKFILRDTFPEIMDKYLTNGTRSIPKVIAFDTQTGEELWTWGPRPEQAAQDFLTRKAEGMPKSENQILLHKWYAADRGKTIENELREKILQSVEVAY